MSANQLAITQRNSMRGLNLQFMVGGGQGNIYRSRSNGLIYKIEKKGLDSHFRGQLLNEGAVASYFSACPGVVKVREIGQIKGTPYIAMEPVEGKNLWELQQSYLKGKIPPKFALAIFRSVLNVIRYLHSQGVYHGDIKPTNIMVKVVPAGDKLRIEVTLIDFGSAARFSKTRGYFTPSYSSPEQVKGKPLDQRSDIFSLGIVLLKMFTGTNPFHASTKKESAQRVENREVPAKLLKDLSLDLSMIILKMLEKNPAQRYQNCEEILRDLKAASL